jgi:hypothetical protein
VAAIEKGCTFGKLASRGTLVCIYMWGLEFFSKFLNFKIYFLFKNNFRKFLKSYLSHEKSQKLEKILRNFLEVDMNMVDQNKVFGVHAKIIGKVARKD